MSKACPLVPPTISREHKKNRDRGSIGRQKGRRLGRNNKRS